MDSVVHLDWKYLHEERNKTKKNVITIAKRKKIIQINSIGATIISRGARSWYPVSHGEAGPSRLEFTDYFMIGSLQSAIDVTRRKWKQQSAETWPYVTAVAKRQPVVGCFANVSPTCFCWSRRAQKPAGRARLSRNLISRDAGNRPISFAPLSDIALRPGVRGKILPRYQSGITSRKMDKTPWRGGGCTNRRMERGAS